MWRIFESAFLRKIAYLIAALLFGLLVGKHAHAQTCPGTFVVIAVSQCNGGVITGSWSTYRAAGDACLATFSPAHASTGCLPGDGAPQSGDSNPGCNDVTIGTYETMNIAQATGSQCPANCSANGPTMDILTAISVSGGGNQNTGVMCVNGCGYTNGGSTIIMNARVPDGQSGSGSALEGKAVPTGATCGASNGTGSASSGSGTQANCMMQHGNTLCVEDSTNTATYNSDIIPVSAPPPSGTCVSYASGGVMCTMPPNAQTMPSPPGPDNGTAGTPATPDAQVIQGGNTVNYYNGATAANSTNGTTAAKGNGAPAGTTNGTGTGTGTRGTGTGNGNGTGTGQGNGDCTDKAGAVAPDSNADCTGTTPDLTRSDSYTSDTQAAISGLMATPLMQGLSGLSTNVGTGSCPSNPITIGSWHTTIDFGQAICNVVNTGGLIQTMQTISDACWYLLGILIVMSA